MNAPAVTLWQRRHPKVRVAFAQEPLAFRGPDGFGGVVQHGVRLKGNVFFAVRVRMLDEQLVLDNCLRLLATSCLRHLSSRGRTIIRDFNQCVEVVHATQIASLQHRKTRARDASHPRSRGRARRARLADGMDESEPYQLHPIGVVRSMLRAVANAPNQAFEGAPEAVLEIDPALADALHRIEPGDELIVLTWLHLADRRVLQTHPTGDERIPLTGVFRTRSPDRPNPIGVHRVTVTAFEGPTKLRVGALEAIDGTPIVDLKVVMDESPDEGVGQRGPAEDGGGGDRTRARFPRPSWPQGVVRLLTSARLVRYKDACDVRTWTREVWTTASSGR